MNEENMLKTLRDVSFLDGVAEEHLERLADLGKFADFPAGKTIFHDGESALHCFLIVDGSVSLEICGPAVGCTRILTLGKGELLGWSPVLGQARLTATARTLTATRTIQLSGQQILAMCEHNPDFGYQLMRRTALALAKRLTAARRQLLKVFGRETPTAAEHG